MKTTIDMPDSLFRRTKALAHKRHVPMREMITEGLMHVLEHQESEAPRRIKPVTFKGEMISPASTTP
jgi:predicted transcriptional regulator